MNPLTIIAAVLCACLGLVVADYSSGGGYGGGYAYMPIGYGGYGGYGAGAGSGGLLAGGGGLFLVVILFFFLMMMMSGNNGIIGGGGNGGNGGNVCPNGNCGGGNVPPIVG